MPTSGHEDLERRGSETRFRIESSLSCFGHDASLRYLRNDASLNCLGQDASFQRFDQARVSITRWQAWCREAP